MYTVLMNELYGPTVNYTDCLCAARLDKLAVLLIEEAGNQIVQVSPWMPAPCTLQRAFVLCPSSGIVCPLVFPSHISHLFGPPAILFSSDLSEEVHVGSFHMALEPRLDTLDTLFTL